MNESKKIWNKISVSYDKQVNKTYKKTYQDTIELSRIYLDRNDRILDFACGTGITTIELAKSVNKIYAIDFSDKMIDIAEKKADELKINNIDFRVSDIFNSQLNRIKFNAVLAFNILYFMKDIDKVLGRIKELLVPDGIFISATDCLGEKKSVITIFQSILSGMGILPYIKKYKTAELEDCIKENGFSIIESRTLFKSPPNYYIAAKSD